MTPDGLTNEQLKLLQTWTQKSSKLFSEILQEAAQFLHSTEISPQKMVAVYTMSMVCAYFDVLTELGIPPDNMPQHWRNIKQTTTSDLN